MENRDFYQVAYQILEVLAVDVDDSVVIEEFERKFLMPEMEDNYKSPYTPPEVIYNKYWIPLSEWLAENFTTGTKIQEKLTWVMQKYDPSDPDQEFPEGINKHYE